MGQAGLLKIMKETAKADWKHEVLGLLGGEVVKQRIEERQACLSAAHPDALASYADSIKVIKEAMRYIEEN